MQTIDQKGEFPIIVKKDNRLTRVTVDHHPFDVVGWDGFYYPWAFNINDFEPRVGRVHLPPPIHQTFEGDGFVVCSFCPRPYDFDPAAVPVPYVHSNVMSDEVLYYASAEFMSRKGIEYGSITLHPDGMPHGPHPGRTEASLGAKETNELAVMLDTFRPLRVAKEAVDVEDAEYLPILGRASRAGSLMTDHTHSPDAVSWVASAADPGTDFPIQNLPFGVFARRGSTDAPRVGVAIGDLVLDVGACANAGLLAGAAADSARDCLEPSLNALMARGRASWTALRHALFALLDADATGAEEIQDRVAPFLVPQAEAEMFVPAAVGDYTDFYASVHHATNVGRMFRPDNPLLPNYKHVPIGYHGRASSIVISGTPVRRPWGQTQARWRGCAGVRPEPAARLRAGSRRVHRPGQQPRRPDPDRRDRGPPLRPLSRERLVGARHPGVGVPAARPVPRQELRHDRVAVGRDDGRARAVPGGAWRAALRRSGAASLPVL